MNVKGRGEGGFTLVEIVVVIAVVLLLTGIAVPMISGYVEDGRRARAKSEIKTLAGAIELFYSNTGRWPARNGSSQDNYLYVLVSGDTLPTAGNNPWNATHTWTTWATGTRGDLMDNQIVDNTPKGAAAAAYAMTGDNAWRGPYMDGTPLDPWGRPYLMLVRSTWETNATNYKRGFLLSAGPDGVINTAANARTTDDLMGDDIGIILHQRM
ncbi:MAG: type II secretion system protein GspG [Planctomycetota bacterium]